MKFEEALQELRKGKPIHRKCNPFHYYSLLSLEKDCDMLAEDWEIMEEPGKTFPEIFEAFKEGKKVRRRYWVSSINYIEKSDDDNFTLNAKDLLATDWEIIE